MWTISKRFKVDYSHRVFNQDLKLMHLHEKCKNFHGHTSEIVLYITSSNLVNDMVLDYTFLKPVTFERYGYIHPRELDHKLLISRKDPLYKKIIDMYQVVDPKDDTYYVCDSLFIVDFVPTAENMARFFYYQLKGTLDKLLDNVMFKDLQIEKLAVEFNETEDSKCYYTED